MLPVFTTVAIMPHVLILSWGLIAAATMDLQATEHFAVVSSYFCEGMSHNMVSFYPLIDIWDDF